MPYKSLVWLVHYFPQISFPSFFLHSDLKLYILFIKNSDNVNVCHLCFTGLPATHFSYIKNIKEGLVLFLFNYSDRKLHGVFEAASPGSMNINKYAWVADTEDCGYTHYPAQVSFSLLCE